MLLKDNQKKLQAFKQILIHNRVKQKIQYKVYYFKIKLNFQPRIILIEHNQIQNFKRQVKQQKI